MKLDQYASFRRDNITFQAVHLSNDEALPTYLIVCLQELQLRRHLFVICLCTVDNA